MNGTDQQISIERLAAVIAHEIRNPITSLRGFLQLLRQGCENKEEYYEIMLKELKRIEEITTQLLLLTKPVKPMRKKVDICAIVQEVIQLFTYDAERNSIEICFHCELNPSMIICDENQLKQVLINLIKNGIESMPSGGKLTIEVSMTDHLRISIKDQGPGIPQEIMHRLFNPFFSTKANGTGLGLMISKKIIQDHRGNIEIVSNKDEGTNVTITLPFE
jgi:signal transduction histidine kinase